MNGSRIDHELNRLIFKATYWDNQYVVGSLVGILPYCIQYQSFISELCKKIYVIFG